MPLYYCYTSVKDFSKHRTKKEALRVAKEKKGLVFRQVDHILEPYFCYRVFSDGKYDGKYHKTIYSHKRIKQILENHFGKKEESLLDDL